MLLFHEDNIKHKVQRVYTLCENLTKKNKRRNELEFDKSKLDKEKKSYNFLFNYMKSFSTPETKQESCC